MKSDSEENEKPQPAKKSKTVKKPAKESSEESSDNNIPTGMVAHKEEVLDEAMEEEAILQGELGGMSQGQESSKIHSNGVNTTSQTI